jgi:peptide/nickel transport system ATP-binding protein
MDMAPEPGTAAKASAAPETAGASGPGSLPGVRSPLAEVRDLTVNYGDAPALSAVSLAIEPGGSLALVGESGSGKSTLAGALLGHLRPGARHLSGSVVVDGTDVFAAAPARLRALRSGTIAFVPQSASAALTPTMRVGAQVSEVLRGTHDRRSARQEAVRLLRTVRLPDPAALADRYPHELSGGQQQRVAIAMAIAGRPRLLVLDEPTTGLDVITQAGVLALLSSLREELGVSMLLVSHDLGVVASVCERVCVLRHGRVVESGPTAEVFASPAEEYTRQLLAAVPSLRRPATVREARDGDPLLQVTGLTVDYRKRPGPATGPTVQGVDLTVRAGEVVALVGESGSGKSTIAWAVAGLRKPAAGRISLGGDDLSAPAGQRPAALRRKVQLIFQSADTSLNPRRTIGDAVSRPITLFGLARGREQTRARRDETLTDVGLEPGATAGRLPAQLSGGQRQRAGIARALAAGPVLVLADEVVSALDVSVQASVLNLLESLRAEHGLGYLFISHDLAVVRSIADRVVVLYLGRVCEEGPADRVFRGPSHPYTHRLLDAVPEIGRPPAAPPDADEADPAPPARGCAFARRCAHAVAGTCDTTEPPWIELAGGHRIRCHLPAAQLPEGVRFPEEVA